MTIRVLVVEDHPIVVSGLAATFSVGGDIEVTGRAISLAEARACIAWESCDLVLLDWRLPDGSGIELLEEAAARDDAPAFLVLSSFMTPEYVAAAMSLGAAGFLLKTTSLDEILDAVRAVAEGRLAYSAEAAPVGATCPVGAAHATRHDLLAGLGAGRSNDELAADHGLSRKTVEKHPARLFARFGVLTRTELALPVKRGAVLDLLTCERRPGPR